MKHRALSMLLALLMVVSLLPIAAVADVTEENGPSMPDGNAVEAATVLYANYEGERTNTLTIDKNNRQECNLSDLYYEEGNTLLSLFANVDTNGENLICGYLLDTPDGNAAWTAVGKVVYHLGANGGDKVVMLEDIGELTTGLNYLIMVKSGETWYKHYVTVTDDSQQGGSGGNGDESQLPTAEDEANAIQLHVESKDGATSYTRYEKDESVRLPWLVYVNESDGAVVPAFLTFNQSKTDCYAIQKAEDGTRTKFGQVEIHTNAEGLFALWKDFPENLNWSEAEKADYVLMFHCNGRWYKFNAQLHAGSAPLVGELVLQYNGTEYSPSSESDTVTIPAGANQVALTLKTKNGERWITSADKLQYSENIKKIEKDSGDNALWQIVLAEPEGESASGYIEYVNDDESTSRVNINCIHSYGDKVTGAVIEQDTDDYAEISDNLVTRFPWDGKTYYLGTAEYQENLGDIGPFGKDERGVIGEDGTYQDMFFAPRVFEYADDDYKLREDIRKEIEDAGYVFKLELLPTDHGCEYYPVTIPVQLDSVDPNTGEPVTETWEQHLVTEKSVGSWIYRVSIVKRDDETNILAENMSMASYLANVYTYIPVTGEDDEAIIGTIKASIEGHWDNLDEDLEELVGTGLYNDFIVLQLPSGEINGQIEIPDTKSNVMLRGAGFEEGLISTTIRGGVKLGDVSCNVEGIHFIGDGTTNEYLADGVTRNSAIYGKGQGVYNGCIFENYYCAIHSSENCAPAWGGWSSVFYKNGTALHLDTDMGGNLEMVDNWFVGNGTAILMDDALEEIYFLQSRQNRFVNNNYDLVNNSGKTMWMSQNFFYHDYDAVDGKLAWEPVLWEEVTTENGSGLQLKHAGKNGAILAEDMREFTNTNNYNALSANGDPQYLNFLPWFDGDDKTLAYPLARTQECNTFFYPNWKSNVYSSKDPYYPSYVQQGVTISEDELDGLRFSSYNSAKDTAVGTFEFSASAAETEN